MHPGQPRRPFFAAPLLYSISPLLLCASTLQHCTTPQAGPAPVAHISCNPSLGPPRGCCCFKYTQSATTATTNQPGPFDCRHYTHSVFIADGPTVRHARVGCGPCQSCIYNYQNCSCFLRDQSVRAAVDRLPVSSCRPATTSFLNALCSCIAHTVLPIRTYTVHFMLLFFEGLRRLVWCSFHARMIVFSPHTGAAGGLHRSLHACMRASPPTRFAAALLNEAVTKRVSLMPGQWAGVCWVGGAHQRTQRTRNARRPARGKAAKRVKQRTGRRHFRRQRPTQTLAPYVVPTPRATFSLRLPLLFSCD